MSISIDIDTKGLETALDAFVQKIFKKGMNDCKSISEIIRDDIKENIMQQRDINGGRLEDNRPFTIAKKGFNFPLVETGKLHDSISVQSIDGGFEIFVSGDRDIIAAKNQKGYTNALGLKVPKRPFFGIRTAIKKDIRNILNG